LKGREMKKAPVLVLILSLSLLLAGCSSEDAAAKGILSYFQALATKDANQLALSSCADWEAQALTELESFGAVEVSLENPVCKKAGEEGDYSLVTCTGKIIANYGDEVLEIDLASRMYLASNEGGDWRMCGYR
jgi:hypothetical protein